MENPFMTQGTVSLLNSHFSQGLELKYDLLQFYFNFIKYFHIFKFYFLV